MFLKASAIKSAIFFEIKEGYKASWVKNFLLDDLLASQHLPVVLETSLSFKNSEKVVKSGYFKKNFAMESANFFRNLGGI